MVWYSRLLFVIIALAMCWQPQPASSQMAYPNQSVNGSSSIFEPMVAFRRTTLSLGSSWKSVTSSTVPALDVTARSGVMALSYGFIGKSKFNDQLIPNSDFFIGDTNFRTPDGKDQKPVFLDWSIADTHSLELSYVGMSVQPALMGTWLRTSVEATGEKSGQVVTASQTWKRFAWGAGGTLMVVQPPRWQWPGVWVDQPSGVLKGFVGDGFSRLLAEIRIPVSRVGQATVGYSWQKARIDQLNLEDSTWWLGIRLGN